jgi:pyruvate kinase
MSIVWGVEAVKVPLLKSADDINRTVIGVFKEKGRLSSGDQVIITSGVPVGVAGATNLILTETVRDDTEVSL